MTSLNTLLTNKTTWF